jgi:hypothetical protein
MIFFWDMMPRGLVSRTPAFRRNLLLPPLRLKMAALEVEYFRVFTALRLSNLTHENHLSCIKSTGWESISETKT